MSSAPIILIAPNAISASRLVRDAPTSTFVGTAVGANSSPSSSATFWRCHSQQASEYAALKLALIQEDTHDRRGYTEAKGPAIWAIMRQASDWSQEVGWEPGSTDA